MTHEDLRLLLTRAHMLLVAYRTKLPFNDADDLQHEIAFVVDVLRTGNASTELIEEAHKNLKFEVDWSLRVLREKGWGTVPA